jgi:hypothetical protein
MIVAPPSWGRDGLPRPRLPQRGRHRRPLCRLEEAGCGPRSAPCAHRRSLSRVADHDPAASRTRAVPEAALWDTREALTRGRRRTAGSAANQAKAAPGGGSSGCSCREFVAVHRRPLLSRNSVNALLRGLLWTSVDVRERDHDGLTVRTPRHADRPGLLRDLRHQLDHGVVYDRDLSGALKEARAAFARRLRHR